MGIPMSVFDLASNSGKISNDVSKVDSLNKFIYFNPFCNKVTRFSLCTSRTKYMQVLPICTLLCKCKYVQYGLKLILP